METVQFQLMAVLQVLPESSLKHEVMAGWWSGPSQWEVEEPDHYLMAFSPPSTHIAS